MARYWSGVKEQMNQRLNLKPYMAKEIDEIKSEVQITYILYRVLANGTISKYGQSQDFEKLTNNTWITNSEREAEWIIKKRVTILKEEPIFKVTWKGKVKKK